VATTTAMMNLGSRVDASEKVASCGLLSGLTLASAQVLARASTEMTFDEGELVYSEGEKATGAYIVTRGKIKLVANSPDGKALILRIAGPGAVIGLSAALSDRNNDTNAEVVEPATVRFINAANLYRMVEAQSDVALRLAQELSNEYSMLCQELSTLGLQRSAISRLAKLMLSLVGEVAGRGENVTMECVLTHEELAQMIGSSRETVTRLLHDLRQSGVALLRDEKLTIGSVNRLRELAN